MPIPFYQFIFLIIPEWATVSGVIPEREGRQIASGVYDDINIVEIGVVFEDYATGRQIFPDDRLPLYARWGFVKVETSFCTSRLVNGVRSMREKVDEYVMSGGGVAYDKNLFVDVVARGTVVFRMYYTVGKERGIFFQSFHLWDKWNRIVAICNYEEIELLLPPYINMPRWIIFPEC